MLDPDLQDSQNFVKNLENLICVCICNFERD
jgi:hypothetical protein